MKNNLDNSNALEPLFVSGRERAVPKNDSLSAERAALKKEADRMIKESAAFEVSKAKWQKKLMQGSLVIGGLSIVFNIAQGVAISVLTPLKTVEPYLLMVDKDSGTVSLEQPLSKALPSYGQVVDSHFISTYVMARESHDWGLSQRNYDTVKSFSEGGSVWNEYNTFIHSPKSPLAILADKARVVVDISSDPLIDSKSHSAVVRFTKTILGPDGQPSVSIPKTYWIATIGYDYPNPKLLPSERRLNPLGMKISSYQVVQEMEAR